MRGYVLQQVREPEVFTSRSEPEEVLLGDSEGDGESIGGASPRASGTRVEKAEESERDHPEQENDQSALDAKQKELDDRFAEKRQIPPLRFGVMVLLTAGTFHLAFPVCTHSCALEFLSKILRVGRAFPAGLFKSDLKLGMDAHINKAFTKTFSRHRRSDARNCFSLPRVLKQRCITENDLNFPSSAQKAPPNDIAYISID